MAKRTKSSSAVVSPCLNPQSNEIEAPISLLHLDEIDRNILRAIEAHHVEYGHGPTKQVIANSVGRTETPITRRLNRLQELGLLEIQKITARTSAYIPHLPGRIYDQNPCPTYRIFAMNESNLPTPGSQEAINIGCKCPDLDNKHGSGALGSTPGNRLFWINSACPVHGSARPPEKQ